MSRRGTYFASKKEKHSDMCTLVTAREKQDGISTTIMIDKRRKNSEHKYIFRPTIKRDVAIEKKSTNTLVFLPDPPKFGVVCQGFKWQLTCKIGNAGLIPERMKVTCQEKSGGNLVHNKVHCSYQPVRLAAGMKTDVVLTIHALSLGVTECELRVYEVSSKTELVRTIQASVVTPKLYKALRLELISRGKNIVSPGVKGIGQELSSKEFLQDSKMSDEERDEVIHMPYVDGVYYNPWEKQLLTDQKLLDVVVDPNKSQQECIDIVDQNRKSRFVELESQGFYTTHAVALSKTSEALNEDEIEQQDELECHLQPINEDESLFTQEGHEKGSTASVASRGVRGAYMKKFADTDMGRTNDSMKTTVRR